MTSGADVATGFTTGSQLYYSNYPKKPPERWSCGDGLSAL